MMRLSFNQKYDVNLNAIIKAQEKMQTASNKLNFQTRILTPADDPSGAARVSALEQQIETSTQFQTNSNILKNGLSVEETVLSSIQGSITRARTLTISLGNGSYSQTERSAVAKELTNLRSELFDLMNQKDSNGGFIFSGFKEQNQTYTLNPSTGYYDFGGDEGQKFLQISNSVTIPINDSGKNVFENVDARYKTTSLATAGGISSAKITMLNQSAFDEFYRKNYDAVTPANNNYRVNFTAPDQYDIRLQSGAALVPPVSGTVSPGQAVNFQGLSIEGKGSFPGSIDFSLKAPEKKNILNTLTDIINAVEKNALADDALQDKLMDATNQMERAAARVGDTISSIGGRQNLLTSVAGSTADLKIANTQYRADIYEIDLYEGLTELTKQETILQTVQGTFTKVTSTSLFDYIR
jgi:flagellar hook-associated protein 3 FlgL